MKLHDAGKVSLLPANALAFSGLTNVYLTVLNQKKFDDVGTSSLNYYGCMCIEACVYSRVCLSICEFVHLDYHELPGKWPLITFIFSCNLKAITISLGSEKA